MAANSWLEGIQLGSSIASNAMARNERMQQLRSQETLRRMQERQAAAQMELTLERVEQLKAANLLQKQQTAEMTAAQEGYRFDIEGLGMPVPLAIKRNLLPVMAKYDPDKALNMAVDLATLDLKEIDNALRGQPRPETEEKKQLTIAQTKRQQALTIESETRTEEIKKGAGKTLPMRVREFQLYLDAEAKGDSRMAGFLSKELGIGELSREDRMLLSRQLQAMAASTKAMLNPEEAAQDMEALVAEFKARRGKDRSTAPAPSDSSTNKTYYIWRPGGVVPVK